MIPPWTKHMIPPRARVWPCVNPHDVLDLELDMAPASSSENPAIRAILSSCRAIGFSSDEKVYTEEKLG